jgi:outer membrane protein TolC
MKDWKLLAALPLVGGLWAASSVATEPVLPEKVFPALDQILQAAVHQSPRMLDKALDLEIAENDRVTGKAGMLPSASGYYRAYESRDKRADLQSQGIGAVTVQKVYYDASIVQPIFFWGERRNNAKMWEIRQKISQGNFQDAYHLLAQDIRGKYLTLITLKLAAARARFNQRFTKEQLAIAEDRLARKVISEIDISAPRLNAERADLDVEHTAFDLENARQTIARIAGVPIPTEESIPDAVPVLAYTPETFDHLLADYVGQKDLPSSEAANLRYNLEVQKLEYANQKVRLRPKFSLAAGVTQDEQSYTVNVANKYQINSFYAGLQVTWTIFDGFAAQAGVRNALARRRQMENDYKETTERLIEEAKSQVKQVYFSARTMSLDDRYLKSSESFVLTRKDDLTRGIVAAEDVSLAQLTLFEAQIASYNARIDFLLKTGELLGLLKKDPVLAYAPAN